MLLPHSFVGTATVNMPIDKGGQHMLTHRQTAYQTSEESIVTSSINPLSSFYVCEPTTLYSPCYIQLRASFLNDKKRYLLETGGVEYISPVAGKIDSVRLSSNSQLFLNERTIEVDIIKNTVIKKGDKLSFSSPNGLPANALIEILILCPIVKTEG
jgi:hypothetical protein